MTHQQKEALVKEVGDVKIRMSNRTYRTLRNLQFSVHKVFVYTMWNRLMIHDGMPVFQHPSYRAIVKPDINMRRLPPALSLLAIRTQRQPHPFKADIKRLELIRDGIKRLPLKARIEAYLKTHEPPVEHDFESPAGYEAEPF